MQGPQGPQGSGMLYSILKHACSRVSTCSIATPQTRQVCDLYTRVPAVAPTCPAATRCLRSIDELDCDAMSGDPSGLWKLKDQLTDCADAMSC
jgi:hypothetical protein